MTEVLAVAAMLLHAGALDIQAGDALDVDEAGFLIMDACGEGPREEPTGLRCVAALCAIWHVETAGTFALSPVSRGTGAGPGQVVAGRLWTSRTGEVWTPPRDGLGVPSVGLTWAVELLRWKAWRLGGWDAARVLRAYNGSAGADRYAARALRVYRRALDALGGEGET